MKKANGSIELLGISEAARERIMRFYLGLIDAIDTAKDELLPCVCLVAASELTLDSGQKIRRENHFVLGAVERSKILDDFRIEGKPYDIIVQIPGKEKYFGKYFLDLRDGEIVNAFEPGQERGTSLD